MWASSTTLDPAGGPDTLSGIAADTRLLADRLGQVATIDPQVLVRPFASEAVNTLPRVIEPTDYFTPSALALLLQHLAVTFAALSLVRDRRSGLFELLRVGPMSSMENLTGEGDRVLAVGTVAATALLAAAVGGLGVPLVGDVVWVVVIVLGVALASIMLGMVFSILSATESQAVQFAMLSLLAGLFFSGFILGLDELAYPVKLLSWLLPVTYGIQGLETVMLRARPDVRGARRTRCAVLGDRNDRAPSASPAGSGHRTTPHGHRWSRRGPAGAIMCPPSPASVRVPRWRAWWWRGVSSACWATTPTEPALAQDSLETLDDTIDVAETVVGSVETGLGTLEEGLRTMSGATAGTVELSVAVADLTASVPDTLDDVDTALGRLQSLGATMDTALRQLSQLPVGPDYDPDISFDGAVAGLREDLAPLADGVRDASVRLDDLATSAEPVPENLEQLADDVGAVRTSLAASGAVLERYRITAAEAATLAEGTRDDLDGEVTLARVLAVVLGLTVAAGQIVPYWIGRDLRGLAEETAPAPPAPDDPLV